MPAACPTAHALHALPCRLAALGGLILAVTGCASPPPSRPDTAVTDVPAAWAAAPGSATPGAALNATWWQRFNDPLLTDLVRQALQTNTSLRGARAALRQARALRDVAAAGLLPALGGSASAQRGTAGGRSTGNLFQAGLDASWEADLFGANRSALAATQASADASAASLGDVQVSITAELALAYIGLRGAQAQALIATRNLASQQETLQITDWRRQAGLVTTLDTEQARAGAEQTAATLPVLATRVRQTGHAIAVLTGQPPAALLALLAATAPVPLALDGLHLSFPADTLRQRADVRVAELQVAAAAARVDQAGAARLPNFKLGGSLGLSAVTLGALTGGSALASSLLASVSLPVFDGGAGRAQVLAQQAALDQARSSYRATVLTALKDVEDALVALAGDRDRLLHLRAAADAASNAALLANLRYGSGLVDFQTVLSTQRTQLSTQDSVASASADVSADQVRLFKALGGGWRADIDTTRTSPSP